MYQSTCNNTIVGIITYSPIHLKDVFSFFYVGKEVSLFVKNYYLNQLISQDTFKEGNIEIALADSFHHMDEMLNVIVRKNYV